MQFSVGRDIQLSSGGAFSNAPTMRFARYAPLDRRTLFEGGLQMDYPDLLPRRFARRAL